MATSRLGRFARGLVAVASCAFAAHAVAYGSPWPGTGAHGYFSWYAPLLAVLSGVSLVVLPLALALSLLTGRERRLVRVTASLLPEWRPGRGLVRQVSGLAARGLVFLAVQETLERSLLAGRLEPVSFDARVWLMLVVTLAIFALMVTLVERVMVCLVESTLSTRVSLTARLSIGVPAGRFEVARRRSPLAVHGALRAPPAFS